ncbi:hypothetical protein [Clostridium sp. D33t1_170424_F3]|uniref:hypothetical protein n=1 Tax=Clostridium sp. D33t1_170424_F3 TaxID=2787099 RepID=UPI0018A9947F|nr:hypothetical protein [Clostridium sp. D33t1_170424_F3]
MKKESPYIKHSRLGVILFAAGLTGAFATAMASDSGILTVYQVLILAAVESLAMGVGGVLADKPAAEKSPERRGSRWVKSISAGPAPKN